ncbi:MAG: methyl-accepting chemotaxis protein [Gammaproteobacteria bacterium]
MTSVIKVWNFIDEIATASKEQASGFNQINKTVADLDDLTQQNVALAEETSAASVSMSARASELINQVSYFRVNQDNNPATLKTIMKPVSKKSIADKVIANKSVVPMI